jgi:hypothetical protein
LHTAGHHPAGVTLVITGTFRDNAAISILLFLSGPVCKAEHRRVKRIVALKMLPMALMKNPDAAAQFLNKEMIIPVKLARRQKQP